MNGLQAEKIVHAALVEMLAKHKPKAKKASSADKGFDLAYRLGKASLVVQVKALAQLRIQDLIGRLAAGGLEVQRFAEAKGHIPLVAVAAPVVGSRAMFAADRFMEQHLPNVGWMVCDEQGRCRIRIAKLSIDEKRWTKQTSSPVSKAEPGQRLFADLNRWLLKILLLSGLKPSWWAGPKARIHTAAELQQLAGVSLDKVYKFIRQMQGNDFLRKSPSGLRLVRKDELIELWFAQQKLKQATRVPVRSLFGKKPKLELLASSSAGRDAGVLGGFGACKALGVLHAHVDETLVHLASDLGEFMERYQLEPCDERDSHLLLTKSKHPESVFRAASAIGKLQVVDVFQAALDVVAHPARGLEQAEHIKALVLESGE
jgi:hypothetical protein